MFKFGDLVIGNKNNHYGYTKEGSLNLVLKIINSYEMVVITLESPLLPSELNGITREEFNDEIEDILSDRGFYNSSRICAFRVDVDKFTACTFESYEEYKATRNNIEKSPAYDFIIEFMKEKELSFDTTKKVMEPVLHTNGTYSFTNKQKEYVTKNMAELLTKYDHMNSPKGINKIWNVYCPNKEGAAAILSKHPNWVEDAMAVVLEGSYQRTADSAQINKFADWCEIQLGKWAKEREYRYFCSTVTELRDSYTRMADLLYYVKKIKGIKKTHSIIINGMNFDELVTETQRVKDLFDYAYTHSLVANTREGEAYLSREDHTKYMHAVTFISIMRDTTIRTATEEFATEINKLAEPFNFTDKNGKVKGFGAVAGQKISRIVGKFFKNYEFDKITDYRSEIHLDEQGVVHEGVKRDYGWNREYALYCDAINVLDFKRWTIISVNPLDYLTMSFGHRWQSCHTIDKRNIRGMDGSHVYHGMYCSGTMSYMLDKASVIMYTIDEKYKGTEYWKQDKFNRCMFHIGEDKFVQGRLYPDGRDGGDNSLAAQFRNIFQKVITDCIGENNLWKLCKGTNKCSSVTSSHGTHYRDYLNYADCSVSYLKRDGVTRNDKVIEIGHDPICPNCGEEHKSEQSLTCYDCPNSSQTCHYCDDEIDPDDCIIDEDTGNMYCSYDCANNDDVYYCNNVGEWHSENVYWDNYCDEYFYATDEMVTVEGRYDTLYYMDSDNAESDGWHYVESENEWLNEESSRNPHREEIIQCYECGEWFMADTMREDMYGDWYCEDCAENNPERFENEDGDLIDENNGVA